jgi:hypothetical protein
MSLINYRYSVELEQMKKIPVRANLTGIELFKRESEVYLKLNSPVQCSSFSCVIVSNRHGFAEAF